MQFAFELRPEPRGDVFSNHLELHRMLSEGWRYVATIQSPNCAAVIVILEKDGE